MSGAIGEAGIFLVGYILPTDSDKKDAIVVPIKKPRRQTWFS
jgi:hypothetical protein